MKTSRIALLAALGVLVMTLPAAAATAVSGGGTNVGPAQPASMQLAQSNTTRAINEARGGDFKKTKVVQSNRTREINEARGGDYKKTKAKKKMKAR